MRFILASLLCFTFLITSPVLSQDASVSADGSVETNVASITDSPLLRQPESARELLEAAQLMTDLARYRLGKRYLELMLELDLEDAELLELRDRFGPAEFLRLSRVKELRPASSDLLKKMNDAFRKSDGDTERIDALVAKLSATPREREVALSTLRDTGVTALPRLLASLGDPADEDAHKLLVYTLAKLGPEVVPPLVAALDSPNAGQRISVAEALGWIGSRSAVPSLLYTAYSTDESPEVRETSIAAIRRITKSESIVQGSLGAAAALRRQALAHFKGDIEWEQDTNSNAEVWVWDKETGTVAPVAVSPEAASLYVGTRFAAKAARLSPENAESQAVFLALSLGREAHAVGWDKPLLVGPGTAHDLSLASGETASLRALQVALENHNAAAARAALQVLGELGLSANGDVRSLDSALNYPNSRVQFAAANAIMNRGTQNSSQRLIEVFSRVLSGSGAAHAVVIDPNLTRSQLIESQLDAFGIKAKVAQTGRQGFRLAAESSNVGLVLVNANCTDWGLSETIANLRADARIASAPIVILGAETSQTKLKAMAARHHAMTVLDESLVSDTLARRLQPFVARYNPVVSQRERAEQRSLAVYWLAELAESNASARIALSVAEASLSNAAADPKMMGDALSALSRIPTTSAQNRLFDIVMATTQKPDARELAAVQLAAHIQRHGILLQSSQRDELQRLSGTELQGGLATAISTVRGAMRPDRGVIQDQVESFSLPVRP